MVEQLGSIFTQMVALFAAIGVGDACKKAGVMDADMDKKLSRLVLAAMPVATNGTMLCCQYHGDARAMAQGTFITTVLSLATIPLLATIAEIL